MLSKHLPVQTGNRIYSPETLPIKWIGTIKKTTGTTLKVYETAQHKYVVMFPMDAEGRLRKDFTSVRVTDLCPAVRLRLCC